MASHLHRLIRRKLPAKKYLWASGRLAAFDAAHRKSLRPAEAHARTQTLVAYAKIVPYWRYPQIKSKNKDRSVVVAYTYEMQASSPECPDVSIKSNGVSNELLRSPAPWGRKSCSPNRLDRTVPYRYGVTIYS